MSDSIITYLEQHLDEYVADLRLLSGIDSGTDDKAGVDAVQDWLAERLQRLGFSVERRPQTRWGDDLVARGQGRAAPGSCCLGMPIPSIRAERPRCARSGRMMTNSLVRVPVI